MILRIKAGHVKLRILISTSVALKDTERRKFWEQVKPEGVNQEFSTSFESS